MNFRVTFEFDNPLPAPSRGVLETNSINPLPLQTLRTHSPHPTLLSPFFDSLLYILSLHTTQTYSFFSLPFTTYYSNIFVLQLSFRYILLKCVRSTTPAINLHPKPHQLPERNSRHKPYSPQPQRLPQSQPMLNPNPAPIPYPNPHNPNLKRNHNRNPNLNCPNPKPQKV